MKYFILNDLRAFVQLFGLCCLSVVATHCTYDQIEPAPPAEFCETVAVTYTDQIEPIITRNCSYPGCHASGFSSGDYSSYEAMLPALDRGRIRRRVIESGDMPPTYATGPKELTEEEFELFSCWLAQGHPQ